MGIKQMIIHSNLLAKIKNKILPISLQGNNRDSQGEFSNTSYGVLRAERVKHSEIIPSDILHWID